MKRLRIAAALLAVAAVVGAAAPASAAVRPGTAPDTAPGPWQPYRSSPFVSPAGDECAFALAGTVVRDQEEIRTLAWDSAGNPTEQEVTGPLVFRYTDESTGASVVRNLDGTAWLFYHPDGSQTWVVVGHLGMGVHAGNPYQASGHYVLTGRLVLAIHADGDPQVLLHRGPTEDLCTTLG